MVNKENKPILCLDFDGVIHSYKSGWQGIDTISDPSVEGAMEFLDHAVESFDVYIFSTRSSSDRGILAMQTWLKLSLMCEMGSREPRVYQIYESIKWPTQKPPAMITIDDRAIQFDGNWPLIKDLLSFQPWYKV